MRARFHRQWTAVTRAARCEMLERRRLLSLAAVGAEFRINTFTTSDQSVPMIAADADGDFVAVWDSFAQDGSGRGIYAQQYNAAGVAQGAEFRVNTFTTGDQRFSRRRHGRRRGLRRRLGQHRSGRVGHGHLRPAV